MPSPADGERDEATSMLTGRTSAPPRPESPNGHASAPKSPAAVSDSPFADGRAWLTVGLILTVVAVGFQALAIATVLPAVIAELGDLHLYGWAFSAFLLTQLVGIVVSGLLADEHGPALPFGLGVLFFAVGLLVGGLAPSMPVLIAGRALQGIGGGAVFATAYVAIGRGYPASSRPRMLALLSTGWVVPGLIGPAIAGLMAEAIGWRSVFLVLMPMPLLAGLLAFPLLRGVPAGVPAADARSRVLSAIVLAIGTGLVLTGIGRVEPLAVAALVGVGLALAIPSLQRLMPPGTLRAAPGMPAAIATMALLNLAFFGVDAFIPLGLVDVRGASVAFAGLALTAGTLAWTSGSWIQARFGQGVSRRTMERIGLSILAVGVVVVALVLLPTIPIILGPIGWAIAGLGIGLSYITLNLTMLELAKKGQEGRASSSMQLAGVLGSALGTGIGGALIGVMQSSGGSVQQSLLIHNGVMLGAVILAIVTARGLPSGVRAASEPELEPEPE